MTDAKVLFRDGVNAIRNEGDLAKGRKLLTESLRLDPQNDVAWLWVSKTVSDTQKKLQCVERALQINPENQQALDLQHKLQGTTKNGIEKTAANGTKAATKAESELETSELGDLIAKLGVNWGAQLAKLVWFAGTLFLVFICFMAYQQAGTADDSAKLIFGILGLLPLCGGIYILGSFVLAFGQQMEIYEDGIAHIDGDKKRAFRWNDFTDIKLQHNSMTYHYFGIPVASITNYDLQLMGNGKKLINLTKNYSRYQDAGSLVLSRIVPLILEQHYKALKQGETLEYGRIKVNREGLHEGRKSIGWNEIAGWAIEQGTLVIEKVNQKRRQEFQINNIMNGTVLVALIDRKIHS